MPTSNFSSYVPSMLQTQLMGRWLLSSWKPYVQRTQSCTRPLAGWPRTIGRHARNARRANVQLQLQSLTDKATLNADSNALRARCLQAEVELEELKGKIDILEQRGRYREPHHHLSCSGALFLPCAWWVRRRAHSSGLSSTWGRNEWIRNAAGAYPPSGRVSSLGILSTVWHMTGWLYPFPFPWDRIGAERAHAKPVFGGAQCNCRASPRAWRSYGY